MVFPDAVRENQKGVAETLLCLASSVPQAGGQVQLWSYAWHLSSAQVSRTQVST